jgi:hypothetical protein
VAVVKSVVALDPAELAELAELADEAAWLEPLLPKFATATPAPARTPTETIADTSTAVACPAPCLRPFMSSPTPHHQDASLCELTVIGQLLIRR